MSKEVMKLAVEALEGLEALLLSMGLTHLIVYGDAEKAITNLQKQLEEQPAQQQEPVALETVYETIIQWDEGGGKRSRRELARRIVDLYKSPPAQRKPLTDEQMFEMAEIAWRHGWASCRDADYVGEEAEDEQWGMVDAEVVQNIAAHGIKEST